ncbi:MAG: helix-turn-helix domain-containing protein [Solirubrobacterales bacterium]
MDDFEKLIEGIEEEARDEGPGAVREWEGLRSEFRIANQLIALRRARNLTQQRLAELSGIAQSEISRIETGAANPTYATLSALAGPLGAEVGLIRR